MTTAPPSADTLRRARTFWEQSGLDLAEARRRLRGGDGLDASYLSFQAAINALTSLCYLHGEFRVPNHSATQLAARLQELEPELDPTPALAEAAAALDAVQGLTPYAAQRNPDDERRHGRLYYDHGSAILNTVKRYLKRHRKRFFAP